MQTVRISNIEHHFLEKVVLPQQRILFEARSEAELEIYTYEFATALLDARIACEQLQSRLQP